MKHRRLSTATAAALAATVAMGATASAAGTPSITSLKTSQKGNKVTVSIKTANFQIDGSNVGKKNAKNRGHQHFSMDGGKFDFAKFSGANGKLAQKLGVQGKYSPSVNNKVTYTGLPKGKHKVTVFLVKNDHSNYGGKATKSLSFTVR